MNKEKTIEALKKQGLWDKVKQLFSSEPQKFAAALADGTAVEITPGLEMGATVTIAGQPAPDGTHALSDGTKITTAGGVISAVEPASAPEMDMNALPAMFAAEAKKLVEPYEAKFTAQEKEISDLKTKLEASEKQNGEFKTFMEKYSQHFAALDKIVEAATEETEKEKTQKKPVKTGFSGQTKADRIAQMVLATKSNKGGDNDDDED